MEIHQANPGERIDIGPLVDTLADAKTGTLCKTDAMEVLRLVLPAGRTIAEHKAPGEIEVQCIEGRVQFTAMNKTVAADQFWQSKTRIQTIHTTQVNLSAN